MTIYGEGYVPMKRESLKYRLQWWRIKRDIVGTVYGMAVVAKMLFWICLAIGGGCAFVWCVVYHPALTLLGAVLYASYWTGKARA